MSGRAKPDLFAPDDGRSIKGKSIMEVLVIEVLEELHNRGKISFAEMINLIDSLFESVGE